MYSDLLEIHLWSDKVRYLPTYAYVCRLLYLDRFCKYKLLLQYSTYRYCTYMLLAFMHSFSHHHMNFPPNPHRCKPWANGLNSMIRFAVSMYVHV